MSVVRDFEKLLANFFSLYHPRQSKKVEAIAQEFKGQEVAVLKSLCDRYKKAYKVIPGLVEALEVYTPPPAPIIEPVTQIEESEEEVVEVEERKEEFASDEETDEIEQEVAAAEEEKEKEK